MTDCEYRVVWVCHCGRAQSWSGEIREPVVCAQCRSTLSSNLPPTGTALMVGRALRDYARESCATSMDWTSLAQLGFRVVVRRLPRRIELLPSDDVVWSELARSPYYGGAVPQALAAQQEAADNLDWTE